MTVELRPLGVKCNLHCQYCYQNPQREAGAVLHKFDVEHMLGILATISSPFALFGGEPLLVPLRDLELILASGFKRHGRNSIQTNGSLITPAHLALFERYNVHVGISLDGPGELNDARWAGSLDKTRKATARTEAAVADLCKMGRPPTLIITIHRGNAVGKRLDRLVGWFHELEGLGVRALRIHLLEVESVAVRQKYALTIKENIDALLRLAAEQRHLDKLALLLFRDIKNLLRGDDTTATCVWRGCDPYTTQAVQGIDGNGQRTNCGRTNKDGIDFVKSDSPGFERYVALYLTPQDAGGCSGCRYFLMCKGQCPGTAIDGDWRNRTEYCEVWLALFSHFEEELIANGEWVLSRCQSRREIEMQCLKGWLQGRPLGLKHQAAAARALARGSAREDA